MAMVHRRTPLNVFSAVGPFSDALISGEFEKASESLGAMRPLDAVRLLLASARRSDSVIGERELDDLAEYLGVFEEEASAAWRDDTGNPADRLPQEPA